MFDIHSHALPFVDDGSDSVEESIKLLKSEQANGVKNVILTPHYKKGSYECSVTEIKKQFDDFCHAAQESKLDINLYLGQEIYCDSRIYDLLKEKKVLTLNGGPCVLVEFDYFNETDIQDYVYNIKSLGYIPVIAHVERYRYLDWNTIFDLRRIGALIQVNASSITGEYGKQFQKKVITAMKKGLIDFVASDIHKGRECTIQKAFKIASKAIGKKNAQVIFKYGAEELFL